LRAGEVALDDTKNFLPIAKDERQAITTNIFSRRNL